MWVPVPWANPGNHIKPGPDALVRDTGRRNDRWVNIRHFASPREAGRARRRDASGEIGALLQAEWQAPTLHKPSNSSGASTATSRPPHGIRWTGKRTLMRWTLRRHGPGSGVTCDTLMLSVNKYPDDFCPGASFESAGNPVNKICRGRELRAPPTMKQYSPPLLDEIQRTKQ